MIVRSIKTFVTYNLFVITKRKIYCNVSGKSSLIFMVHWIVDCYGRFAANVERIELASAIFTEEIWCIIGGNLQMMLIRNSCNENRCFEKKKYQNYARKTEQCQNNVQSSKI